jgi:autotransporter-associated beta strand protein
MDGGRGDSRQAWPVAGVEFGAAIYCAPRTKLFALARRYSLRAALVAASLAFATAAQAQDVVNNTNNSGAGSLSQAITNADANPGSTITFSLPANSTITLTSPLPAITSSVTINGVGSSGVTVSGGGSERIFFVQPGTSGTVTIENLTLANGMAQGGAGGAGGGGGGMGAGAAIFVGAGSAVAVANVGFSNNAAAGGAGGAAGVFEGGGGGGLSGNGGNSSQSSSGGGGGGGGIFAGQNGAGGANNVGGGNGGGTGGGTGGAFSGGGNGGTGNNGASTGGGGGGGGSAFGNNGGGGGSGGFGSGGGGGGTGFNLNGNGGNGGFGGGGGSGGEPGGGGAAGNGGFGGGGAASGCGNGIAGQGGAGGGAGASNGCHASGGGGGGSAFGGAVFTEAGATLTIATSSGGAGSFTGSAVTAGTGTTGGGNGAAAGSDLFLQSGTTTTLGPAAGTTLTFNGTIADDSLNSVPSGQGFTAGSGAGAAIGVNGGGNVVLNGANTYSGGTTLTAGTLTIGNNSALGSGTLAMAAGTTLASNGTYSITNAIQVSGDPNFAPAASSTLTIGGAISDGSSPGFVNMQGPGTLVLSVANSYSGGTTVSAGTLQISGTGTLGATTGTLGVSGGTLDLGATTQTTGALTLTGGTIQNGTLDASSFGVQAGTVSAILGGAGALTKTTAGTVTLSGVNTYTGATTINGGTLELDGSIANTSSVTVNSGGTLSGTGVVDPITTMIMSGGTLAPGNAANPTGTLTITGNLALQSGALYLVQVTPSAASATNVSGNATLAGTVDAVFASGTYAKNQYTILQSAGLGGTTFSALTTTNLPAGFKASLVYTGDDVLLDLAATLGGLSTGGLNINQQNVANALNTYFNSGGTLPANFVNIFGLTGGSLANALTQLDGEAATGAERAAFQLTDQFLNLMLDPFLDGRLGGGGIGGGAHAIGFAPDEQASLPPDIALAYASVLKAPPAPFAQRWTAWGSAYGGSSTTSGDPATGSSNVTAQTYGFAGGMDYHYSPDTIFGFALAGGGTNWGLAGGLGGGRSDAMQTGVYGITRSGPAYLAAALSFTNHWMTTDRAAFGDQLTANFDAQSYGARVETGYRYAVVPKFGTPFGVTPYAALQAQDFHTPSYSETDVSGGGFGLSYNAMNATDIRSELGARFDDPTLLGGMPLILRARVAWAHDWVSDPALGAVFEALPGASFVVNGAPLPSDSALTSVGAELYLTPRLTLLAKFDGEFANGSQTYAGSGTLRYTW